MNARRRCSPSSAASAAAAAQLVPPFFGSTVPPFAPASLPPPVSRTRGAANRPRLAAYSASGSADASKTSLFAWRCTDRTYETNARWAVYLSSARDESSACSLSRIAKTFDAFVLSLRSGIRACWSRFTIGASDGSSMSSARPFAVYRAVRPVRWM